MKNVYCEMFLPKTIKISLSFFKLLPIMSRMVFIVFFYFNADFMCFDFPGSAEAYVK